VLSPIELFGLICRSTRNQPINFPKSILKESCETPPQSAMPDPSLRLLLWQGGCPKRKTPTPDGRSPHRGPATSPRIPGTPFQRRDTKTARPEDRRTERHLRPLRRTVQQLQRHCARPPSSPAAWEEHGGTIIPTTFKRRTGGAMEKRARLDCDRLVNKACMPNEQSDRSTHHSVSRLDALRYSHQLRIRSLLAEQSQYAANSSSKHFILQSQREVGGSICGAF